MLMFPVSSVRSEHLLQAGSIRNHNSTANTVTLRYASRFLCFGTIRETSVNTTHFIMAELPNNPESDSTSPYTEDVPINPSLSYRLKTCFKKFRHASPYTEPPIISPLDLKDLMDHKLAGPETNGWRKVHVRALHPNLYLHFPEISICHRHADRVDDDAAFV